MKKLLFIVIVLIALTLTACDGSEEYKQGPDAEKWTDWAGAR